MFNVKNIFSNFSAQVCDQLSLEEESLKAEHGSVKAELRELHSQLEQRTRNWDEMERGLRSELSAARARLTRLNSQLGDVEADNCELKERLRLAGREADERGEQVAELRHALERATIEHSRAMAEREAGLAALQARLEPEESGQLAAELAESEPGGLAAVGRELRAAAASPTCPPPLAARLTDAAEQLSQLTALPSSAVYRAASLDSLGSGEAEEPLVVQLTELRSKLDRMEAELSIVSEESSGLQRCLETRERTIEQQVRSQPACNPIQH